MASPAAFDPYIPVVCHEHLVPRYVNFPRAGSPHRTNLDPPLSVSIVKRWSVSSKFTISLNYVSPIVISAWVTSSRVTGLSMARKLSINVFLLHLYPSLTLVYVVYSLRMISCWLTTLVDISSGQSSWIRRHTQLPPNSSCSVPIAAATNLPLFFYASPCFDTCWTLMTI